MYGPLCPQGSMPELRRSENDHDSITSTQAVVMGFPGEEGDEESAQGSLSSSEEGDREEEGKDEVRNLAGDIEAPSPPQPSLPILPLSPPRSLLESGSTSSFVRGSFVGGWRSIPSSFKLWRGASLSRGVSQATSHVSSTQEGGALAFVDHILLLYPLPAEDPLLPLRRAQALGDSFGQGSSVQTRGTSLFGNKERRTESGVDRGASFGCSDCASSSSSGGTPVGTRELENLHCIPWTRGLEYDVTLPYLSRDSSSSSSIFSPGTSSPSLAAVAAAASRVVGGTPLSSQYGSRDSKEEDTGTAARVNVLTMGSPRLFGQHGLIKFVGKRGKELGQGVFTVELQEDSCGRGPLLFGGSGGSERRRSKELVTRQTVELSVGGRYRGTFM